MEELIVEERKKETKGKIKEIRKRGFIPGIVYGGKKENILIHISKKELIPFLSKKMLSLKIGERRELVLIKEKQIAPLKNEVIHIDFMRVSLDSEIETKVRIRGIGIPEGVKDEAILEQHIYEVNIKCHPKDIKEAIDVPLDRLEIGKPIYIKDIITPPEIEIIEDKEKIVFSLLPKKEEIVPAEVKPEIQEPEVIKKGKKEEDEWFSS